jgi:hypothetical protein
LRDELKGERVLVADPLTERASRPRQPRANAEHEIAHAPADLRRDPLEQRRNVIEAGDDWAVVELKLV